MGISLHWSDSNCNLDGRFYDKVPFMMDEREEVITAPTDWFRHVTVTSPSMHTVRQYAFTLTSFWRFLFSRRKAWTLVTDSLLRKWRSQCHKQKANLKPSTWNSKLSVVLHFYIWAQKNGYVEGIIGETVDGRKPPIAVWWEKRRYRTVMMSDILLPVRGKTYRGVPTHDEMDDAYAELAKSEDAGLAARNVLMMRWAEAGLRRSEFAQLRIADLPTRPQIFELERSENACNLPVLGKGGKRRVMAIDSELLISTLDYIETERRQLLEKLMPAIQDDSVFLSARTGRRLGLTYISQLLSRAFQNSPRWKELSGHRARARHLTKLLEVLLSEHEEVHGTLNTLHTETILFRVAEQAGHNDINTLRAYLAVTLKKHHQRNLVLSKSNRDKARNK